jgi:hypothetical protein
MTTAVRPLPFLAIAAAVATLLVVVVSLLPHDPYIRFQQLARESVPYLRIKWIYERIHFDQTPIDIAFIGTSHTQSGVNSRLIEESLAAFGDKRHVVNLAVPHLGRDMNYLVARELLENRKVQTLVVEVQYMEARAPHPGFQRLATVRDILTEPLFVNVGVADNLARLPMRQLELFAKTVRPGWFGLQAEFANDTYEGPHYDDTYLSHGTDKPRTSVNQRAHFEEELGRIQQDIVQKQALARRMDFAMLSENPLYRVNDIYLKMLLDLAERRSVKVVFMYLPHLDAQPAPDRSVWFAQRGEVLVPADVIGNAGFWQNADHLNFYGANALSTWLATKLHRGQATLEASAR